MKSSAPDTLNPAASVIRLSSRAVVIVLSLLTIGGVNAQSTPPAQPAGEVTLEAVSSDGTPRTGGLTAAVDPGTGGFRPLTSAEAQRLAVGLKDLISQSTEGLVQITRPNGAVSMDLQGRFQNVLLARLESDGTVEQACVDNIITASNFFDLDPNQIGTPRKSARQSVSPQNWPIR